MSLLVALPDERSFFFSGEDAADDERLLDPDELDDDEDEERLEADEELVLPDELEPLELERDARLRLVFDGDSLEFFIVSVSTVILQKLAKMIVRTTTKIVILLFFPIDYSNRKLIII